MLKIIGILILIASGSLGGYFASIRLTHRVRFIEEYMEFIKIIQNEIRYTENYLSEIIEKYCGNGPFYSYLGKCNEYIKNYTPFPLAWENTFHNVSKEICLSPEFANIINNFGLRLGTCDIDGQLSHCQYNYELAKPYLQEALEDKKSRGKLYSTLGTCIGIFISLFFI